MTWKGLNLLMTKIASVIDAHVKTRLAPLEARIAELETIIKSTHAD